MRLLSYLNEALPPMLDDRWLEEIRQNCKPFLKDLGRKTISPLLRGHKRMPDDYFKGSVRKDRHPLDTPKELHTFLDKLFHKKFGWKPRSGGLFVTNSYSTAREYGEVYRVYPVGKYKLLLSEDISDLYDYISGDYMNKKSLNFDINNAKIIKNDPYVNRISSFPNISIIDIASIVYNTYNIDNLSPKELEHIVSIYATKLYHLINDEYKEVTVDTLSGISDDVEIMLKCDQYYMEDYELRG